MLPVAVEVAPADPPREQVAALLSACSRAVGDADCVLAEEAPPGGTQAVAIVTWQSDGRAMVEVGLRREGKPEWRARSVAFSASDELLERWRAVGFVVGTLARGEAPAEPAKSTPEPPVPEPAEATKAKKSVAAAPLSSPSGSASRPQAARASLELGAVLGPGLGGLRTGGVLRARGPLFDPFRSLFALRYVEHPTHDGGVRGQWLTLAAGVSGVLGISHAELNASLDLRAEYFRASATDSRGRTGSESRWLPGLALGVGSAWVPVPAFGLYLAAEGAWMLSTTDLRLGGEPRAEDRALRGSVDAGVRFRLW